MPTDLDFQQVIRNIYDEATNRIRTDTATVLDGGDLDVLIVHTEDSIRLGDGTNFITSTTIGPDIGLDVNVINPLSVEIDAADGDNIAIHDNEGDELEINADGSINVNASQSGIWTTGRTWTLDSGTDSVSAVQSGVWNINDISGIISLPTGASTSANQLTEIGHLSSIDTDIDVALSTRASEVTLSTLNNKVTNDYGASSGAVRTASQIGNTTGTADFNAGVTSTQTLRTTSNITRNGTELSYNIGTPDANTLRVASILANSLGQIDYNHGTVGAQTIRVAAVISNETTDADFNAGTTSSTTLRTTSNITRNGTELNYNYGTVGADTLRSASQIGNATGAADFNAGSTGAQTVRTSSNITRNGTELSYNIGASDANTLRTASNFYDGSANALTSQVNGAQRALDIGINVAGVQIDPRNIGIAATTTPSPISTDTVTQLITDEYKRVGNVPPEALNAEWGQMFSVSTNSVALTGTTETAFFYFQNPNGSGKNAKIFDIILGGALGVNDSVIYRIYFNPTVTVNGTVLTEVGHRQTNQASNIINTFITPTVSSNGTLIKTILIFHDSIDLKYKFNLWIEPNNSLLITRQISSNTTIGGVNVEWTEQ